MVEAGTPVDTRAMDAGEAGHRAGRAAWRLVAAGLVLLGLLLPAGAAAARTAQDDPYGSTTTTSQAPGPTPTCRLSTSTASPGDTVVAHVQHAPRGGELRILFDGETVAETTADGPGQSPWVNVDVPFVVPEREPGTYPVMAVGAQMAAACGSSTTSASGEAEVQGLTIARGSAAPSAPSSGGGLSALPKTGIGILLLLAVALALLVVGRPLVAAARRREGRGEARPHLHR